MLHPPFRLCDWFGQGMNKSLRNVGRFVANDIEAIGDGLVPQRMYVAQPEFIRLRG